MLALKIGTIDALTFAADYCFLLFGKLASGLERRKMGKFSLLVLWIDAGHLVSRDGLQICPLLPQLLPVLRRLLERGGDLLMRD